MKNLTVFAILALPLFLMGGLTACGQKGALYIPQKSANDQAAENISKAVPSNAQIPNTQISDTQIPDTKATDTQTTDAPADDGY